MSIRRFRILAGASKGNSMIEFAFVMPVLMLLLLGTFEFGHLFYVQLTLESAVREATRLALTGGTIPGLSRAESIVERIRQVAPGLDVQPGQVAIIGPGGAGDPGGPGDLVTIRVDYDIEMLTPIVGALFPDHRQHFSISFISRNEPFPDQG